MKKVISWTLLVSVFYSICLFVLKKYYFTEALFNLWQIPLIIGYMWIPGVIALIFSKKEGIELPILRKLNKYVLYACFVPIIINITAFLISFLFAKFNPMDLSTPGLNKLCVFDSSMLNYLFIAFITIISGILIGGTLNILTTLGEELMWRGYLFEKLKHLGFWKASTLIGIIWGIWHIPVIILMGLNYPQNPILGSLLMIIGTVLMSPIFQYLRIKGKSILLPAIFHGILNRTAAFTFIFFADANRLLVGPVGVAGFIALGIIDIIIYKKYKNDAINPAI